MDMSIEVDAHLRAFVIGDDAGEERRLHRLKSRALHTGIHVLRQSTVHEHGGDVEPVNAEVVQQQVMDVFKRCACGPGMIPVQDEVDTGDLADDACFDCCGEVAKVRCPSAILIHGELPSVFVCQLDQALAFREVEHEGLLAEHVLACFECVFDDLDSRFGMWRRVNDVDVSARQDIAVIRGNESPWRELQRAGFGFGQRAVADRCHLPAHVLIGTQMSL